MRWPFSRNKNVDGVPLEIQEYYQTERRERTGIAWLLALGTLVITVGLATLLFFGGRWVYRKVADRNDNKNGQTSQVAQNPSESSEEEAGSRSDGQPAASDGGAEDSTGTSSTSTSEGSTAGRATTPVTGDGLPDTGPGEVLGVFAAVTVAGTVAHSAVYRRQS